MMLWALRPLWLLGDYKGQKLPCSSPCACVHARDRRRPRIEPPVLPDHPGVFSAGDLQTACKPRCCCCSTDSTDVPIRISSVFERPRQVQCSMRTVTAVILLDDAH